MGTGAVKVKAIQRRQGTGTAHERITIIGTGAVEVPVPSHDECRGWGMDGTQKQASTTEYLSQLISGATSIGYRYLPTFDAGGVVDGTQ